MGSGCGTDIIALQKAYEYIRSCGCRGATKESIREFIFPKTKSTEFFLRIMESNGFLLYEEEWDGKVLLFAFGCFGIMPDIVDVESEVENVIK